MSLDTLSNVKTRLGITTSADDTLLGLLQNSADQWVVNYVGRDLGGGTYTEYHPGGAVSVHLRNYPVQSVTSVNVDPGYSFGASTVVSPTRYVVHFDRGVIESLAGPFAGPVLSPGLVNQGVAESPDLPRVVQVVYTVASGVAHDILEAYAQLIGHWYCRVKTRSGTQFTNLSSQHVGETQTNYARDAVSGLPIPPDVTTLLAPYRVPNL